VTEVRDGIDQLTARAADAEVAAAMVREMAWYDAYLKRGGVDRSANTTPGNKAGGLSNIVEKAMGSIVKSGSSTISGVLAPGEKLTRKGLVYAATPASDFICGTLQLAGVAACTCSPPAAARLTAWPNARSSRSPPATTWHDAGMT
jgi:galactarate dehydratase